MRSTNNWVLALGALLAITGPALSAKRQATPRRSDEGLKHSLASVYSYVNAEIAARNSSAALAYYAPDFALYGTDRRKTSRAELSTILDQLANPDITVSAKTSITSVSVSGKVVVAYISEQQTISYKDPASDKTSEITTHIKARDAWTMTGNRWAKLQAVLLSSSFTTSGNVRVYKVFHW